MRRKVALYEIIGADVNMHLYCIVYVYFELGN
jgi:hypothetical protein